MLKHSYNEVLAWSDYIVLRTKATFHTVSQVYLKQSHYIILTAIPQSLTPSVDVVVVLHFAIWSWIFSAFMVSR